MEKKITPYQARNYLLNLNKNIRMQTLPKGTPACQKGKDSVEISGKSKDWTVLAYLNGNNDLEFEQARILQDLEKVGSSKDLNIVTQIARAPQEIAHPYEQNDKIDGDWSGARRYYVTKNEDTADKYSSQMVEDLKNIDMGSSKTLEDFLLWGIKAYPAEHYLVILGNHGHGFLGISDDDISGKRMAIKDMAQAFSKGSEALNSKFDVVVFDACLMAQTEVAYELANSANYIVGSEEVETLRDDQPAISYNKIERLKKHNEDVTPRKLVKEIIKETSQKKSTVTTSAIDLNKINLLKEKIDVFAEQLLATKTPLTVIKECAKMTQSFSPTQPPIKPESDYRDLFHFAKNIASSEEITDEELRKTAIDVMSIISSKVVVAHQHLTALPDIPSVPEAHGISIYLPVGKGDLKEKEVYGELKFSKDSKWDEFITKLTNTPDK